MREKAPEAKVQDYLNVAMIPILHCLQEGGVSRVNMEYGGKKGRKIRTWNEYFGREDSYVETIFFDMAVGDFNKRTQHTEELLKRYIERCYMIAELTVPAGIYKLLGEENG